jgi:inner membrane protein
VASAISHPAVVLALAPIFRSVPRRLLWLGALCSVVPDVDAVGFWFGIPYGHPLGHRGLTHSFSFAALLAAALAVFASGPDTPRLAVFGFLFCCGASHGVIDAMTDGGLGVAFFAPFTNSRYFLPWRPIRVSPIGISGFLGRRGLDVLRTELVWIWLPSLAFGAAARLARQAAALLGSR